MKGGGTMRISRDLVERMREISSASVVQNDGRCNTDMPNRGPYLFMYSSILLLYYYYYYLFISLYVLFHPPFILLFIISYSLLSPYYYLCPFNHFINIKGDIEKEDEKRREKKKKKRTCEGDEVETQSPNQ